MFTELPKSFDTYLEELISWNKKVNLTSIINPEDIKVKHFYDSLLLTEVFDFSLKNLKVIDVGSGAGFPGLPLKIIYPNLNMTLLDSTKKKIDFLNHIIKVLDLKDIQAIWSRAEDFATIHREEYDIALARALAPLNIAVELCLPFLTIGGLFFAMKSEKVDYEIEQSKKALEILGGEIKEVYRKNLVTSKDSFKRNIVIIEKIKPTPKRFPRKAGFAKKYPIT